MIYNNNLEKLYTDLEPQELGQAQNDDSFVGTQEASSQIGKTVEEVQADAKETSAENEDVREVSTNEISKQETTSENKTVSKEEKKNVPEVKVEDKKEEVKAKEEQKDPEFAVPVEGEIIKEFAQDKLVYSETLKEWVVHTGVDIKADKTTVVKAAEAGKVTAIKNDPRYGITVIVEHSNGFETRYANLLTAEFVSVGEEVTKGQTIGTVGNTATFEVLDDFHLHFEILKDGAYQDPVVFVGF